MDLNEATPNKFPREGSLWPSVFLSAVVIWNFWETRASLKTVPYFNDMVLHQQMVRFASFALSHGHLPFTQWYGYLNLGAPQFLHYQGLGATLVGAVGLLLSPAVAFKLSLYLLWALWPVAIYWAGRIWGFSKWQSVAAALASPFLVSFTHIGYESKAYEWYGYGVWAQLCASWALPFAWAWTWRALKTGRGLVKAGFFIALTSALHFETGYSAFIALLVFPWLVQVSRGDAWRRFWRVGLVAAGGVAWVVVPLLLSSRFASINSLQVSTLWARGYGAKQNLRWLFHGQYFDYQRWPILTILLGVSVIVNVVRWRRGGPVRAAFVLMVGMFMISWGPTTWGLLANALPGHSDIFFRRFQTAVDLAGLYVIGSGAVVGAEALIVWLGRIFRQSKPFASSGVVGSALACTLLFLFLIPSGVQAQSLNSRNVSIQLSRQVSETAALAPIIGFLQEANDGRVYAGLPWNWGLHFEYGVGPMYMYLADNDIAQVSTQGWVASTMENQQARFDERNLNDYRIFAVKYILLPANRKPSVASVLVLSSGPYRLWEVQGVGYFSVVTLEGFVNANKRDIGSQSDYSLRTQYFSDHIAMALNYGSPNTRVSLPTYFPPDAPGSILSSSMQLASGTATADVLMNRHGNVVFSMSIDPGWQVFVDGQLTKVQFVAPGLLSVPVSPGNHLIFFRYQGFRWYLPLVLLGLLLAWFVHRKELEDVSTVEVESQ